MFVRGVHETVEYNRNDNTFYKGIVVRNDDPYTMCRVKVFIPELSQQPYDGWLDEYLTFNIRFPGALNKTDSFSNRSFFYEVTKLIPWAEPCFPLMGEGGPARYFSATILERDSMQTDSYTQKEFLNVAWRCDRRGLREPYIAEGVNDRDYPRQQSGSFSPAYLYECFETTVCDRFSNPHANMTPHCNAYSYQYRPSKHVNKSKGVFGVPQIGTKVWVFHESGDVNTPVYFGTRHDYRETSLIYNLDQPGCFGRSLDYPGMYENIKTFDPCVR